jgi:hypothetical protein
MASQPKQQVFPAPIFPAPMVGSQWLGHQQLLSNTRVTNTAMSFALQIPQEKDWNEMTDAEKVEWRKEKETHKKLLKEREAASMTAAELALGQKRLREISDDIGLPEDFLGDTDQSLQEVHETGGEELLGASSQDSTYASALAQVKVEPTEYQPTQEVVKQLNEEEKTLHKKVHLALEWLKTAPEELSEDATKEAFDKYYQSFLEGRTHQGDVNCLKAKMKCQDRMLTCMFPQQDYPDKFEDFRQYEDLFPAKMSKMFNFSKQFKQKSKEATPKKRKVQ